MLKILLEYVIGKLTPESKRDSRFKRDTRPERSGRTGASTVFRRRETDFGPVRFGRVPVSGLEVGRDADVVGVEDVRVQVIHARNGEENFGAKF